MCCKIANVKIVCIKETFLSKDEWIIVEEYNQIFLKRKKGGRGLALLLKKL